MRCWPGIIDAPFTDVFGLGGRQWLAEVQLPAHEREQVDSNLRLHDALDVEVELVERQLAEQALARPDVRRLMTIPGVGAITALALVAVIGDVSRFPSPRHLVGYLGLDPRVRQSGEKAARHGHISRAGQAHARGLLVEAAHTAIRTPGPLRAFHARIAVRRGKQVALCATARKLTVLTWHLLTKDEDYRFAAPTITQRKLRSLQRKAGDTQYIFRSASATYDASERERALELLERTHEETGVQAHLRWRGSPSVGRGLHELCEVIGADLLVVGSSRRGLLGRVLIGDDARAALNGAPCAIAIAIAPAGYSQQPVAMREIGVGYDGSPESEHAVAVAREVAAQCGAKLSAFEAVSLPTYAFLGGPAPIDGALEDLVDDARKRIAALGGVEPHAAYGTLARNSRCTAPRSTC
jgi:nucleotide-binding universal stress UspA family protein